MDKFETMVNTYVNNKYGKEKITKRVSVKDKLGTLGATEFTLIDGNIVTAYFHYQLEKVCVLGEPYWE